MFHHIPAKQHLRGLAISSRARNNSCRYDISTKRTFLSKVRHVRVKNGPKKRLIPRRGKHNKVAHLNSKLLKA